MTTLNVHNTKNSSWCSYFSASSHFDNFVVTERDIDSAAELRVIATEGLRSEDDDDDEEHVETGLSEKITG